MKQILIIFLALIFSCSKPAENKPETKTYSITIKVSGIGNYEYGIGKPKVLGHCSGTQLIYSGIAKAGDYVFIHAKGDSIIGSYYGQSMNIEIDCDPRIPAINNTYKAGVDVLLSYQFN